MWRISPAELHSMATAEGENWLDGLGWTALETSRVGLTHSFEELLLPSEDIVAEGRAVVLVNMDVAGTLLVTNFRLVFVVENQTLAVPLGTIPLSCIEKFLKLVAKPALRNTSVSRVRDRSPTRRLLQVVGKDMRNIVYGFRPRTKQRRKVFWALTRLLKTSRLWDLYAFGSGLPAASSNGDPLARLHAEYLRIISRASNLEFSERSGAGKAIRDPQVERSWWRISDVNAGYAMCPTYPSRLIVPSSVSDDELLQAAVFRARGRLPVLCWQHFGNGAVLARSSQPLIGIMMNSRSNADEKVVAALCPQFANGSSQSRKLYIADARPRKNALANGAMGGGSESSANYLQSEVVFLGIDNIHVMRDSVVRLRDYLDLHGGASSDGSSSLLRTGGWAWRGSTRSSMSAAVSALGDSGWLMHLHSILSSAAWIAGRLVLEGASVLVHCSDGWDRTSQLISLAELLLDPYYRTFEGFQALIEKDWLAFGHPFADRLGVPTFVGDKNLQADVLPRVESTSPVRNNPVSSFSSPAGTHSPGAIFNNYSPVFLQWADCVAQLLRLYPRAFEFSSVFVVELVDSVMSCRFGNFFCNNERERVLSGVADSTPDLWSYLENKRSMGRDQHEHYNILYDPAKNTGALLPPAAALAPILWPQFYLRWACPSELDMGGHMPTGLGQGGDLEKEARVWAISFSSLQRSKERAEQQLDEVISAKRALEEQLQNERQHRTTALTLAGRAQQETASLRRVLDAMGCKIRISKAKSMNYSEGEISYEENCDHLDHPNSVYPQQDLQRLQDSQNAEGSSKQLAVSVSLEGDSAEYNLTKSCGVEDALSCGSHRLGDLCKWPQSRCARLGSAFVGLKADFDALEQLSILDCYFDPDQGNNGQPSGVT